MAVTRRNKIAVIDTLPNEFRRFTDRDIRWLWHYLTKGPRPILKLHNDNSIQYQTEVEKIRAISRLLRNNDQLINRLINYHSEYVLDSRYLTWIDKSDVRLLLWLHLELNDIQASDLRLKIKKTSECSTEMLYEDIIFSIDTWRIFSVDKIEMLNKMKTDLTQEKTSYPMMKWLDEKTTNSYSGHGSTSYLTRKMREFKTHMPNPITFQQSPFRSMYSPDHIWRKKSLSIK